MKIEIKISRLIDRLIIKKIGISCAKDCLDEKHIPALDAQIKAYEHCIKSLRLILKK